MQSQTESQQIFTYIDSELDLTTPELYQLDIAISAHRLSFTISQGQRVLGFRYAQSTENILQSNGALLKRYSEAIGWNVNNYRQVRVFIHDVLFTLVPEALFDVSQAESYLNLLHKLPANHETLAINIPKHQAVCVFALHTDLFKSIKQLFNPTSILHQAIGLLQIAALFNQTDLKQRLLVEIDDHFMTVLYYQQDEVKYMNTFMVEVDTDITYFILSVAELLKLSADKCGIYLLGQVSVTSSTIGLLKKYIPEVIPISRMNSVTYPASFREFQEQQHYLPLHSLLCE
jgi:hypothetical protein